MSQGVLEPLLAEDQCHTIAALNPTRFLNREQCRAFLLQYAEQTRAHKFERVSSETLVALNEVVRAAMIGHIKRLPSKGKTI